VSEQPESPTLESVPAAEQSSAESAGAQVAARVDERPELAVGAAFGGGFLLALILKRLAG
jgi:hypothetical protein